MIERGTRWLLRGLGLTACLLIGVLLAYAVRRDAGRSVIDPAAGAIASSGVLGPATTDRRVAFAVLTNRPGYAPHATRTVELADTAAAVGWMLLAATAVHGGGVLLGVGWWSWRGGRLAQGRLDGEALAGFPAALRLRAAAPTWGAMAAAGLLFPVAPFGLWALWQAVSFAGYEADPGAAPGTAMLESRYSVHPVWVGYPVIALLFAGFMLATVLVHAAWTAGRLNAAILARAPGSSAALCEACGYQRGRGTGRCPECGSPARSAGGAGVQAAMGLAPARVGGLSTRGRWAVGAMLLAVATAPVWAGWSLPCLAGDDLEGPLPWLKRPAREFLMWAADADRAPAPLWRPPEGRRASAFGR